MHATNRREFLGGVGRSVGYAALGLAIVERLGFAGAMSALARERLRFGALDPLVDLMQETPADALLSRVVHKLRSGTPLADLVGAGALANARAFGGTHYNGYHALMAMMPSFEMAAQMRAPYGALPVLKVLHRNARFIQDAGRAKEDALEPLEGAAGPGDLVQHVRARELERAEQSLSAVESRSPAQAFEELQVVVRDEMNVHLPDRYPQQEHERPDDVGHEAEREAGLRDDALSQNVPRRNPDGRSHHEGDSEAIQEESDDQLSRSAGQEG
jgi:hypothetical protein